MPEYPECDKFRALSDESRTLHEFLEWLESEGLRVCSLQDTGRIRCDEPVLEYFPTHISVQDLVYRFLDVDGVKLEQERRAMLEEIRNAGVKQ